MSTIITPFDHMDAADFASHMKKKISGANLSLEYDNIESTLAKTAIDCSDILGEALYENICKAKASKDASLQAKALDFLERSMLHFCLYEHLIFLITQIKNSGVTVTKSGSETTVFKYLQDELDIKLVSLGWFWMNRLIKLIGDHPRDFENTNESLEALSDIAVDLSDFDKWVGIHDQYFIIVCRWLIREVWMDCVLSRVSQPQRTDEMIRALCYEVTGRACKRLAFHCLPEPIRRDINNEMTKNRHQGTERSIRETIADTFLAKAAGYWAGWESMLAKEEKQVRNTARPIGNLAAVNENDSFVY